MTGRGAPADRLPDRAFRPLAGNPLRTRSDVERAAHALLAPLFACFSPGGARVRLGTTGVFFSDAAEELEGFARPLWAIVPLALGGGGFDRWDLYRRGLESGADPGHPEFWGAVGARDQRMVEMAAIGFALAFAPQHAWDPLPEAAKENLVAWLAGIDRHPPHANNWQFFRVMVHLGLERVGRPLDEAAEREALAMLESHYAGDGFYRDGPNGHVDYYVPWAYHTYGLLYAAARPSDAWGKRYRERARLFAEEFQHWFDARGAALPFGRSLTYRFAQGCFWGALAFAGEEALPWGRVKGLYLRHLRSWAELPIADRAGVLTLGYGYENPMLAEPYSSAGSPYWAMKAFLALAAPERHPFWRAEEEPPDPPGRTSVQVHARMLVARDETQVVALSAGQGERFFPNGPHKYGKFAYSSRFGFGIGVCETRPHLGCHDSMLAVRAEENGPWRVREETLAWRIEEDLVYARWSPLEGVEIETVLGGGAPWHVRLHRLETSRRLWSLEAGFALAWEGFEPARPGFEDRSGPCLALARTPDGTSGLRDLLAERRALVQPALPNTNVLARRTVVPVLHGDHAPGLHRLECAVWASASAASPDASPDWEASRAIVSRARALLVDGGA